MTQAQKSMTFAEFGEQFMEKVVTASVIQSKLEQVVPKTIPIDETDPVTVKGTANVSLGAVASVPSKSNRELVFNIPLNIQMTLYIDIKVGQENYEVLAQTALKLSVTTAQPLNFVINVAPLSGDDVKLVSQGAGNLLDVAKKFGRLDVTLRHKIADKINAQLQSPETLEQETIRVLDMVQATMAGGSGSSAGGGSNGASSGAANGPMANAAVMESGKAISATLAPGQSSILRLPHGYTDAVEFTIYTKSPDVQESADLNVTILDSEEGSIKYTDVAVTPGSDWGRDTLSFSNIDSIEDVFVRVRNDSTTDNQPPATISYRIKFE